MEKLPQIHPSTGRNLLRLHRLQSLRDWLAVEQAFSANLLSMVTADEGADDAFTKELESVRGMPLGIATLDELVGDDNCIISSSTMGALFVPILSIVDREALKPGCSVLIHDESFAVVGVLAGKSDDDPLVNVLRVSKAPAETYAEIGGLEDQIREIKEAVELPLTHPELYEVVGVTPPKGCILYGPPGTGKTLLAKAVANSTSATFIRVTGSELVQKYLGEGPRLVRQIFRVARENAPSIVFIDEIDAVGTKRHTSHSSGGREVQRTMLELLNQLDGFDHQADIKVIMATNRIESLDPALLRPGRLDRKVEFPPPDLATKRRIMGIHVSKMSLAPDVEINTLITSRDQLSGADIKAMCTEAGLMALRERQLVVTMAMFEKAKQKILYKKKEDFEDMYL